MSTILKALRRLEEEKARGATSRPLREEVASGPGETRRRGLPWLPVVAMLLGALLGASAWWVWPYERGGKPVRDPAAGEAAGPAPLAQQVPGPALVSPPDFHAAATQIESQLHEFANATPVEEGEAPVEATPPGDAGPPEDAFASGVAVVERPTPVPRIPRAEEKAEPERVISDPPGVAVEPPAAIARRPKQPAKAAAAPAPRVAPAPPPAQAVAKTPIEAPARPVPASESVRPGDPRPASRVASKSAPAAASRASEVDTAVRVKRTQWHPEPGRRSADLELAGKTGSVHEGDLFGEYVVTEIRPSGVVLTRDGQRIERGIGK